MTQRLQNGDLRDIVPDFKGYRRLSINDKGSGNAKYLILFNQVDESGEGELDYDQSRILFDRVNEDRISRGEVPFLLDDEKFGKIFAD